MKYLLFFILCCNTGLCQKKFPDHIKVTAYRLVDEYDDGPCSILEYVKEGVIGGYVRGVESADSNFAYRLIELKEEAQRKWKQNGVWCDNRCIGCETIPNMFIVQVNAYLDTIYTTRDNASIFIPQKQKEYLDPGNKIKAALPKEAAMLFEKDFYSEMHFAILDSIPSDKVRMSNKPLHGMTRKSFESEISGFDIIETDSMLYSPDKRIEKLYHFETATVLFKDNENELVKLEYSHHEERYYNPLVLSVDGIVTGITEDVLIRRFPNSTKHKAYMLPRFSLDELKDNYFYSVDLENETGWVEFYFEKGILSKIEVNFDYPR